MEISTMISLVGGVPIGMKCLSLKFHKAIGLMQIMPETVGHLGSRSKDIKDHFIEISLEDARDPSVAIAAATRWLFRKHRLVKGNNLDGCP